MFRSLPTPVLPLAGALAAALLAPAALAAGVSVRFDTASPAGAPFPSNRYTVADAAQATLRRVALPKPDCAQRPSDCADIDVLNTLDGFSTQPRITIPFDGDIDPASVNSGTVYLLNLGQVLTGRGAGERVGINQAVWDPASKTLVVQSDALLAEQSRYLLVVTDGVRDRQGRKIQSAGWGAETGTEAGRELRDALQALPQGRAHVAAASVFTTQSASTDLLKIKAQIKASVPAPVDFRIGNGGTERALFPLASVQAIQFARQVGTAPSFSNGFLPTPALATVPGAVGQLAYGRFRSPDYQTAQKYIPATPTLTGAPQVQGHNDLLVQVFLPAGAKPAGGWPVALMGHGFTDSMYGMPWTVAAVMASHGIATVSINVVGHGGGAQGSLTVLRAGGAPVVLPAGGRGIDQDGNGSIDSTEGVNAAAPRTLLGSRDGLRQTVVDYMQLVRQIEAGVDIDGDGSADLDAQRIFYGGQSFGGIYGTILLGVEPSIRAGVPNVPGGSIAEVARLGGFRGLTALALASRQPSLLNGGLSGFNENLPLRDEPVRINTVAGAMAIAEYLDRSQWATQAGNPVSYAPLIRKQPPAGHAAKPVVVQFAKGDTTVPNPTSSAIIRAGDLADRVSFYRNDLAYALNPAVGKNPHTFLSNIFNPAAAPYAIGAQQQMARFFADVGGPALAAASRALAAATTPILDPDGAGPIFEVPIAPPLPEVLNYLP